jgi:hypothetical protein
MGTYLIMRAATCALPILLVIVCHTLSALVHPAVTTTAAAFGRHVSPAPSSDLTAASPCVYPLPSNSIRCSIDEPHLRRYNVCDPHRAVSMSEC